jgi:hypothetical protein
MWDFSWLERRWPGAGYEDWDRALDGLVERGYNAVRIDSYPHLLANDPQAPHIIYPCWSVHDWGSPGKNRIRVVPALTAFISKCAERGIQVALSSWYQRDSEELRNRIRSGRIHGEQWVRTLDIIAAADLLDSILWVDLCNEWPLDCWAPYFRSPHNEDRQWHSDRSQQWMKAAIAEVRRHYPGITTTFSSMTPPRDGERRPIVPDGIDLYEAHLWMAQAAGDEFYRRIGYTYPRYSFEGYAVVAERAELLYRSQPDYWQGLLTGMIDDAADWSHAAGVPLATTEGWAIVDYRDWPLLDWGWVKEVCEVGTRRAAATGRWIAIATSNFCGPQFRGMWRDVEWHQRLTSLIKSAEAPAPPDAAN